MSSVFPALTRVKLLCPPPRTKGLGQILEAVWGLFGFYPETSRKLLVGFKQGVT